MIEIKPVRPNRSPGKKVGAPYEQCVRISPLETSETREGHGSIAAGERGLTFAIIDPAVTAV
jgi:hypothetical protein